MNLPEPGDLIDIHNHGARPSHGKMQVETLMTHETRVPDNEAGIAYTIGIHPWFLTSENINRQVEVVNQFADHTNVIAIGEAGFDRIKGPSADLQKAAFMEQAGIAERVKKPLVIHCVKAWGELLEAHRSLRPKMPWLIHGFRGSTELASQLISKGMYLSFWFDYVLKPRSANLLRSLPRERIFLETDGSGVDIRLVYEKVAGDLEISTEALKAIIYSNFNKVFK